MKSGFRRHAGCLLRLVSINRPFAGFLRAQTVRALCFAGLALASALGCSSTEPTSEASAGAGGETVADAGQAGSAGGDLSDSGAGLGGSAGEGGTAGEAGTAGLFDPPWNEHSQHIELRCFAYFIGSMEFSAERSELSAEQLQVLAGLRQIRPNAVCAEDQLGCNVAITGDRGEVVNYTADELEAFCGESTPALAYASFAPLLATLGCKFAKESAQALSPNANCFHGLFSGGPSTIHQQLSLSEANRSYHVELDDCAAKSRAGRVTLELFGADPSIPLAVGTPVAAPGPRGTCLAFDLELEAPVIADLVITTAASFGPGDFFLHFR